MKNRIQNRTLEDTRNREVTGGPPMAESISSGVFYGLVAGKWARKSFKKR